MILRIRRASSIALAALLTMLIQTPAEAESNWRLTSDMKFQAVAPARAESNTAWAIAEPTNAAETQSPVTYRTRDGGRTWTRLPDSWKQISVVSYDVAWAVNSYHNVFVTTNGAASWSHFTANVNSALDRYGELGEVTRLAGPGTIKQVAAVSDLIAWVLVHDGSVYRTTNGGTSWRRTGREKFAQISAVDAKTAWAVREDGTLSRIIDEDGDIRRNKVQPGIRKIAPSFTVVGLSAASSDRAFVTTIEGDTFLAEYRDDELQWQHVIGSMDAVGWASDGKLWGVSQQKRIWLNSAPADIRQLYTMDDVHGDNVQMIYHDGSAADTGSIRQTGPLSWVQETADSRRFEFKEVDRNEWSVTLLDASRGIRLLLDLYRKNVLFALPGQAYQRLFTITAAFRLIPTGINVTRFDIDQWDGREYTPARFEKQSALSPIWSGGPGTRQYTEIERTAWTITFRDSGSTRMLIFDLFTKMAQLKESGLKPTVYGRILNMSSVQVTNVFDWEINRLLSVDPDTMEALIQWTLAQAALETEGLCRSATNACTTSLHPVRCNFQASGNYCSQSADACVADFLEKTIAIVDVVGTLVGDIATSGAYGAAKGAARTALRAGSRSLARTVARGAIRSGGRAVTEALRRRLSVKLVDWMRTRTERAATEAGRAFVENVVDYGQDQVFERAAERLVMAELSEDPELRTLLEDVDPTGIASLVAAFREPPFCQPPLPKL